MDNKDEKQKRYSHNSAKSQASYSSRKISKTNQPIDLASFHKTTINSKDIQRFSSTPKAVKSKAANNVIAGKIYTSASNQLASTNNNRSVEYHPQQYRLHYIRGHVNPAFVGDLENTQHTILPNSVHREQYWSYSCCKQRNWSRRARIFALAIIIQSFIIFGLAVALIVVFLSEGGVSKEKPNSLKPPWNL